MAAAVSAAAVSGLLLHSPRSAAARVAACCCACWLPALRPRQALQLAPLKLEQQGVGHNCQAAETHHGACRWEGEAGEAVNHRSQSSTGTARESIITADFLVKQFACPQCSHTTPPCQPCPAKTQLEAGSLPT